MSCRPFSFPLKSLTKIILVFVQVNVHGELSSLERLPYDILQKIQAHVLEASPTWWYPEPLPIEATGVGINPSD